MIYLICTPIGNLNDISLRSIEILNSSDLIYAEDTRKAKKIFDRYKINKKSNTYFIGTENFVAITKYNYSHFYAMVVYNLARELGL